jgi:hypothetical protein
MLEPTEAMRRKAREWAEKDARPAEIDEAGELGKRTQRSRVHSFAQGYAQAVADVAAWLEGAIAELRGLMGEAKTEQLRYEIALRVASLEAVTDTIARGEHLEDDD